MVTISIVKFNCVCVCCRYACFVICLSVFRKNATGNEIQKFQQTMFKDMSNTITHSAQLIHIHKHKSIRIVNKSVHLRRKCDLRYLIGSPTANIHFSVWHLYTLEYHQQSIGLSFIRLNFDKIADNARDVISRRKESFSSCRKKGKKT